MPDLRRLFREGYGAGPLHLLVVLSAFLLTGYAVLAVGHDPSWRRILVWFGAAIIGHDLVLYPVYALADRGLRRVTRNKRRDRPAMTGRVRALNYVRIPSLGAGLTFLLFFPGIIRQGRSSYLAATGTNQAGFLSRWLLLCAAMYSLSAIAYAVRLARDHAHRARRADSAAGATRTPPR